MTTNDENTTSQPLPDGLDTLARRDAVLDRIDRFGMTTVADTHKHVCPEITLGGTRKWFERLAAAGWLNAFPLIERENYYVAGLEAVRTRNLHPRKAKAFGPLAKVTAYGTMLYCTRYRVRKITAQEFRTDFPELCREHTNEAHYFIEQATPARLGLLLIDHGADARRLPAKARKIIRERGQVPGFRKLFAADLFVISIACTSPNRAKKLLKAFRKKPCHLAEVTIETVSELLQLNVMEG